MDLKKAVYTEHGTRADVLYEQDILKMKLITPKEELRLIEEAQNGNKEAEQQLMMANLRFVRNVAKKYQNNGIPLSDLISEGSLGLQKAIHKFDKTRGFKLISYAVWWIQQSILSAINDNTTIRKPANKTQHKRQIKDAQAEFFALSGEFPSPEQLSEMLNLPLEIINNHLVDDKPYSLDATLHPTEDHITLLDFVPQKEFLDPDTKIQRESSREKLENVLENIRLKYRYYKIIKMFYLENYTKNEIMEILEISSETFRQDKEKALKILKANPEFLKLAQEEFEIFPKNGKSI